MRSESDEQQSKEYILRGKELAMTTAAKVIPSPAIRAKVTSKGQFTIPVEVREQLGIVPGDQLRIELQDGGFRAVRDAEQSVFEKWRGIGIPGMARGRAGSKAYMREMRGYDGYDDNLD
jgi:AbrB family looped-hinge helix DNA binding protein